jgi:hypothetical protein
VALPFGFGGWSGLVALWLFWSWVAGGCWVVAGAGWLVVGWLVGWWWLLGGGCWGLWFVMESLILAQDERWRRA